MVKEIQYTSIRRVLDSLMDHPMLRDLTLEQAVRHTVRFIGIHGYPKLYKDAIATVDIHEFRGMLPCDLVSIIQVKDCKTKVCLRSMTDNFPDGMTGGHKRPEEARFLPELSFKTQGRVIYVSFPEGKIEIAYKSIPVDEDGYPMLIDNENYLAALEAYIKKQVFTVKFDQGKLAAPVLQNAQTEYAWLAGQLQAEFQMPSVSEMESISRMMTTLIPRVTQFGNGFKELGEREYLRRH